MLGLAEAEQAPQPTTGQKNAHRRERIGRIGLSTFAATQGRSRRHHSGARTEAQAIEQARSRVPCPLLGSSIARRRSSDLLCRAGVEGDGFTLQHHKGGWREVRAAGGRQRERTRFGQPSR